MTGLLDGVRVLDLTSVVMGPLATATLADLGADVVTVETAKGDTARVMAGGPTRQLSDVALTLLRNKRNVAIDLKHPDGRQALLRIAATCDVVVTNLRPATRARLGLDDAALRAARPDLVICHATGYPADGPLADEPAYDDVVQGAAGIPRIMERALGTPWLVPMALADKVSGLTIVYAILAALFARERTGTGPTVEVAMVDATVAFAMAEHGAGAVTGSGEPGYGRMLTPERRAMASADGMLVVFPYADHHWQAIVEAGGRPDLAGDERLGHAGRQRDPGFGYRVLEEVLARRTTAEWLALCRATGIPAAAVPDIDEVVAAWPEVEHPTAGPYRAVPQPVRVDGAAPPTPRRHAPTVGQHNAEVLSEAGYPPDEIADLAARGVLRSPPDRPRAAP
ncbi:MAG TPA: CoA transferase [Acidimicrobiales bacterium]|nr:CoA transferase [Acidimicrobiales bacterium]